MTNEPLRNLEARSWVAEVLRLIESAGGQYIRTTDAGHQVWALAGKRFSVPVSSAETSPAARKALHNISRLVYATSNVDGQRLVNRQRPTTHAPVPAPAPVTAPAPAAPIHALAEAPVTAPAEPEERQEPVNGKKDGDGINIQDVTQRLEAGYTLAEVAKALGLPSNNALRARLRDQTGGGVDELVNAAKLTCRSCGRRGFTHLRALSIHGHSCRRNDRRTTKVTRRTKQSGTAKVVPQAQTASASASAANGPGPGSWCYVRVEPRRGGKMVAESMSIKVRLGRDTILRRLREVFREHMIDRLSKADRQAIARVKRLQALGVLEGV